MNKSKKQLIRFIFILIFMVLCSLAVQSAPAKEPVYGGKPLSQWLILLRGGYWAEVLGSESYGTNSPEDIVQHMEKEQAELKVPPSPQDAIGQMGTNAIPTLLNLLGADEGNKKRVLSRIESKEFKTVYTQYHPEATAIREIAVKGFLVLGTNAASAVPELTRLLHDPEICPQAASVLNMVGPKGFSVLTNALNDEDLAGVMVLMLGQGPCGDPQAVEQLLIGALKNPNPIIRGNAARFLGGKDATLAVPALIPMLDDSEYYPRDGAAIALATYGPAARSAAPKLLSVYTNVLVGPDRKLAFDLGGSLLDALRKIDRGAAGQAEDFRLDNAPLKAVCECWAATILPNGKELITGGILQATIPHTTNHVFARAELNDPKTGKWTKTGEMNVARYGHRTVLLPNGQVLVVGGSDGKGHDLSSAELYDPATGKWTLTGSMNTPHPSERAALQPNGKVLVFSGGVDGYPILGHESYDPDMGTWTVIPEQQERSKTWRSTGAENQR